MQVRQSRPASDGDHDDGPWEVGSNTLPLSNSVLHMLSNLGHTGGGTPAAPPQRSVYLNMEVLSDSSIKALCVGLYTGVGISVVATTVLIAAKFVSEMGLFTKGKTILWANVAVASVMLAGLLSTFVVLVVRLRNASKKGLKWSSRRRRVAWLHYLDLFSQIINSIFYLIPNVYALRCNLFHVFIHFSTLIRFTMWNNIFLLFLVKARAFNLWERRGPGARNRRSDSILLDAPKWSYWKLGVHWFLFEAASGFTVLSMNKHRFSDSCWEEGQSCKAPRPVFIGCMTIVGLGISYRIITWMYFRRSWVQLKRKSYTEFRWTNVVTKYHIRSTEITGLFVVISFVMLWAVKITSCDSYLLSWFGFLPAQVAMSVQSIVNCIFWLPVEPKENASTRFESQEPCWTEREAVDRLRNNKKKFFRFELALRLYYWCELLYTYDPVRDECSSPPFRLELGKQLFDLQHHEFFRVHGVDTNVIIAWSHRTILVCFRGTSSMKNLKEDIRIWRGSHPPTRGNYFRRTRPMVHRGFHKSWTAESLNHRVVNRIIQILTSGQVDTSYLNILVAGHSLGGALAVLAAFDIARYCGVQPSKISCYTFGAPRVGNHAFAEEYMQRVPDTWMIVNDSDGIARTPKFYFLYKHVGKRIIINSAGDLILTPLVIEVNLHRPFRFLFLWDPSPITHHQLSSYRKSLIAIVRAQFIKNKGLPGGMQAMMHLLQEGNRPLAEILGVTRHSTRVIAECGSRYWDFQRTINRRKRIGRVQRAIIRLVRCFPCLGCFTLFKSIVAAGEIPGCNGFRGEYPTSLPPSSTLSTISENSQSEATVP